jgi:hypothetical protein
MLKSTIQSLLLVCLLAGTLTAANDPFTGKWKLNQSKSEFTGDLPKITALGGNKYRFTDGNVSDTIVADGTDQPIHFGYTESIRQDGPSVWKVVTKKNGRVLYARTWTLVQDGNTLSVEGTETRPDGSTSGTHLLVKRIAGTIRLCRHVGNHNAEDRLAGGVGDSALRGRRAFFHLSRRPGHSEHEV